MRIFCQTAGSGRFRQPFLGMLLAVSLAWLSAVVEADDPPEPADDGVFLPADRELERTLDRARRLLGENRWSDAAPLFDEILSAPRDAFVGGAAQRDTSRSIKAEAWALMKSQPRAAKEAYALLFSARAERRLDEAVAANDLDAMVDVARRWFATPAGQRAAVLSAVTSLESCQPAVATAWLDRLAEHGGIELAGPTLSLMRSVAHAQAGESTAAVKILASAAGRDRIAGGDVELSMPPARAAAWLASLGSIPEARTSDWLQPRGDAARNATVAASRPLLVSRYRVPLTRHPEEARLLTKRAQATKALDRFLLPTAVPLAVDGLILARTPLGILAIDFATGKRLWLCPLEGPAGGDPPGDEPADGETTGRGTDDGEWAFENLTATALVAAEGLVFAVDVPRWSPAERGPLAELNAGRRGGLAGPAGNSLRAFDIAARGAPRWQLPAPGREAWYLGAPLAAGGELYVLVEEKGEIRLDVLDARRGTVAWSQPLAELDDDEQISSGRSRSRRLAGLSPALADGVIVCPLGTGAIVGIDLASRTLLWAHRYPRSDRQADERMPAAERNIPARRPAACGDGLPVIAGGRVLLAAHDSNGLLCLDLRTGKPAWHEPVSGVVQVAGVVENQVIVIGQRAVESRALADGSLLWQLPYGNAGGRPSGRGILTRDRLLLPLDSPEVVEVNLRDGAIAGRSPARGGLVPGNLVAYRGEVISRGLDSLDVFHQQAALETQIRTAEAGDPEAPWVLQWRGQLQLEAGRVAEGLNLLARAAAAEGSRLPPETLPDAIVFGMERDFAAAAPAWRQASRQGAIFAGGPSTARAAARVAIDGFLQAGAWDDAWGAIQEFLDDEPASTAATPTRDPADSRLLVSDDRWLAGRLATLLERGPPKIRETIAAAADQAVTAAAARPLAADLLAALAERLGPLAVAARARELAVADDTAAEAEGAAAAIHREWQLLWLAKKGSPESGDRAREAIASGRPEALRGAASGSAAADVAWPLGRVDFRRLPLGRGTFASVERPQLMPLPVEVDADAAVPGLRLACDAQEARLHVFDGYGRPVLDPLGIDPVGSRHGLPWLPQASGFEAWTLGRMLFVRTGRTLSAYDLAGSGRPLWTHTGSGPLREQAVGLWHREGAGRAGRHGGIPIGLEITEPDERLPAGQSRGGRPRLSGALHFEAGTLALVDLCSGNTLWERHGLPPAADLVGDDEFVAVCTPNGAESPVLSMRDGRLLRHSNLPSRRQRLATSGRRIVAARPLDETPGQRVAETVQLRLIDPISNDPVVLGTVAGESRAVPVGDNLVVLEPAGELSGFDLAAGSLTFRVRLPSMPTSFDRLYVVPWEDRLLVVAGSESRPDAGEWQPGVGDLVPLQHLLSAGEISRPLAGRLWAIGRSDGSLIWPAPAVLDRHCLHLSQPSGLPLLLLSRHVRARGQDEQVQLRLVGLDKRTGHAVFDDDSQPIQPHAFFGCELTGVPERHSIMLRESGDAARWGVLQFTGAPTPPQTPFQGTGADVSVERLVEQRHNLRRPRP